MTRTRSSLVIIGAAAMIVTLTALVPLAAAPQDDGPGLVPSAHRRLVEEIIRLTDEVTELREQLAACRLTATTAEREAAELGQFIKDHDVYGPDFERYQAVVAAAERDVRRREAAANRERREAEKAARRERYLAARAERQAEQAEENRQARYERAGFGAIGLDVFVSRMAYSYETRELTPTRVDYDPLIGLYYRPGGPTVELDYGAMTISGSVLNAADEVRNIGIAVTFFDDNGNQVGGEIVQINNARPDVPYPFTSKVDMALDRPFSSSSTYVLYADTTEAP